MCLHCSFYIVLCYPMIECGLSSHYFEYSKSILYFHWSEYTDCIWEIILLKIRTNYRLLRLVKYSYTILSCVPVPNQSGNNDGYIIVPQSGKKQTTNQYILSKVNKGEVIKVLEDD